MPAYASDGNVVCFFQSGGKFKARYATLGFTDKATSTMVRCGRRPTGLVTLTGRDAKIAKLVKKAVTPAR